MLGPSPDEMACEEGRKEKRSPTNDQVETSMTLLVVSVSLVQCQLIQPVEFLMNTSDPV
jgi:hypothetical protein